MKLHRWCLLDDATYADCVVKGSTSRDGWAASSLCLTGRPTGRWRASGGSSALCSSKSAVPLAQPEGGHVDFYDRYMMNGYDENGFFALAFGTYPNRGIVDAGFGVLADGVQRSVMVSGRAPWDRAATSLGPITVEIVEPMLVARIIVDAPEQGLSADLVFTTGSPVAEEEHQVRYVERDRCGDATAPGHDTASCRAVAGACARLT
jgi:hypothetical protein